MNTSSGHKLSQKSKAGYLHPGYAQSLSEFGLPRRLPHSKGWILERQIPGWPYRDAMGCYPLFFCEDWSKLKADLRYVGANIICLSLVTDPFADCETSELYKCFKDAVIPFKEHFIVDLSQSLNSFVQKHHRRNARKSLEKIDVLKCDNPKQYFNDWLYLYTTLTKRHNIKGIPAFSRAAFEKQFSLPGMVAFRGVYKNKTVGMLLWYVHSDVGYYHLGAYSPLGYQLRASFALFWYAIRFFAAYGLSCLNLGAGVGARRSNDDGLSRFKRGWSTGTRIAYFCSHIFDFDKYLELVEAKGVSDTEYFPAYRAGEFS